MNNNLSVSTRVTAPHTPAWPGRPALWAQRAKGRRSSTTTTSPSAPSSQRTSTPSRSSWLTRTAAAALLSSEEATHDKVRVLRPPRGWETAGHLQSACLCTVYSFIPLLATAAVCESTAFISHSSTLLYPLHSVIFVCKSRLSIGNCTVIVLKSHLR